MMNLDDLYRLLDVVDGAIEDLRSVYDEYVDVDQIADLCLIVTEVLEYTSPQRDGGFLGINRSVLNRYVRLQGPFLTSEARLIAQRLRSFLRSQDQATQSQSAPSAPSAYELPPAPDPAPEGVGPMVVAAEGWRLVVPSNDLKAKITALSTLLDSIISRIEGSNAPPDQQALTRLERTQLIAILETALAILKTPMIERGLLKKLKQTLGTTAAKAAETEAEQGLGKLAEVAVQWLGDLLSSLWPPGGG